MIGILRISASVSFIIVQEDFSCLTCSLACCLAATMVLTLANLEGEESFDASMLGSADEVVQERISDDELIVIKR